MIFQEKFPLQKTDYFRKTFCTSWWAMNENCPSFRPRLYMDIHETNLIYVDFTWKTRHMCRLMKREFNETLRVTKSIRTQNQFRSACFDFEKHGISVNNDKFIRYFSFPDVLNGNDVHGVRVGVKVEKYCIISTQRMRVVLKLSVLCKNFIQSIVNRLTNLSMFTLSSTHF